MNEKEYKKRKQKDRQKKKDNIEDKTMNFTYFFYN